MKHVVLIIISISLFISSSSWSQELESSVRPRIGLALSGGSAHGFAHIGVLKYLEELGIQIDYITGTSMGSVIGGLYALGFDADDIRQIASELDWDLIMSNGIPLNEVAPIEKQFHGKTPLFVLWKDSAFKLPRGIIRGQKLDLVISKVYCPAHNIVDFDDFHIPFRCVGVDIEDGSVDAFERGYVGNAIRASMAIPTVFPPKELNGKLYVDGGLIRNFPVEEVRELGADYVIGVYVGCEKESREDLVSMLDILRQATNMSSILDSEEQSKLTDLLVLPDVNDLGSFDFNNYQTFINKGYEAASEHSEELKALAKNLNRFPAVERNEKLQYPRSLRFSKVTTKDSDPVFEKMIVNEMGVLEDYAVSLDQIDEGLSVLYGTKNFSKAAYTFNNSPEGLELEIDVDEIAPFSLGFNVNRFNLYNSAFVISGEARNVIGRPSNFRLDARISDNPALQGQYYLRIPGSPHNLVKISAKIERFKQPEFDQAELRELYRYEQGYFKAELIREWKNQYLFSLGYSFLHDQLTPETNDNRRFMEYQSERNELFIRTSYNNVDKQTFATEGFDISVGLKYMFNNLIREENDAQIASFFDDDKSYGGADLSIKHYRSLSRSVCVEWSLKGRYTTGRTFLDSYRVGGPRQEKSFVYGFAGLDDAELMMGNHISSSLALRVQLLEKFYLSPILNYIYGEHYDFRRIPTVSSAGFGLGLDYNSPIGPIRFDIGYASLKERVVLNLGLGYRHIF